MLSALCHPLFQQREKIMPTFAYAGRTRGGENVTGERIADNADAAVAALRIAETGHLTFGTLHTNSAAQTINRIIDIFPSGQQAQIRTQLSLVLEGIVCQALLPKVGGGRVVALEILVPTPAIRNLIREDKIHQIYSSMQAGQEKLGTQTFNQSLATLYMTRQVSLEAAMGASSHKEELDQMIQRGAGVVQGAGLGPRPGMPQRPLTGGAVKR